MLLSRDLSLIPGNPTKGLAMTSMVALSNFSSLIFTSAGPTTEHNTDDPPKIGSKGVKSDVSNTVDLSTYVNLNTALFPSCHANTKEKDNEEVMHNLPKSNCAEPSALLSRFWEEKKGRSWFAVRVRSKRAMVDLLRCEWGMGRRRQCKVVL